MDNQETEYVSKSQLKREMHELQKLGEELLKLSTSQLKGIEMPEELRQAVLDAKETHSFIASRRHIQYIGALMREVDPEPIRQALELIARGISLNSDRLHRLEKLRDRLIEGDREAFREILEKQPQTDRQQLNQMIRNAAKEKKAGKTAKHYRALFKFLKGLE